MAGIRKPKKSGVTGYERSPAGDRFRSAILAARAGGGYDKGTVKLLRKGRDWLKALVAAMEYSSFDYTNDRISGLEHELKQLKNELRQTRMSARTADGGFDPSAPARET